MASSAVGRRTVAQSLEHRTGDRGVLSLNPAGGTSVRDFHFDFVNSVHPTLPVAQCLTLSEETLTNKPSVRG